MAMPEDRQEFLDGEPVDQSDPDQSWYFDVPDGAWERQEQKNRDLRDLVRSNLTEKGKQPKAFSGHGSGDSMKEQKGSGKEAPRRGLLRRGSAPAADGTEAWRKNRGGASFDDFSEPEPEPEARPAGPLPLRLRRNSAPLDAIEAANAAAEAGAPPSRWDAMFGGPADMSIVDSMRAWTDADGAPRKPRTLALKIDPKDAAAAHDPARRSSDDDGDESEAPSSETAPGSGTAPEAAVSDFLARIRNRSNGGPKEAPDTFDLPEPPQDPADMFEAFAVDAPVSFGKSRAGEDLAGYADVPDDAGIENPADILGGLRAWASGASNTRNRTSSPSQPPAHNLREPLGEPLPARMDSPEPPRAVEPATFELAMRAPAPEPVETLQAGDFPDAPIESSDDIVGGLRAWAMTGKASPVASTESRVPRLPVEPIAVPAVSDEPPAWEALSPEPVNALEPARAEPFFPEPVADVEQLVVPEPVEPFAVLVEEPAVEGHVDVPARSTEPSIETPGGGGLRAWMKKAVGLQPKAEPAPAPFVSEPARAPEMLDWEQLANAPADISPVSEAAASDAVTPVADDVAAPGPEPVAMAVEPEPTGTPIESSGDDIVGGLRAWAMEANGPESETRPAAALPMDAAPVTETLDWEALAAAPAAIEPPATIEPVLPPAPFALESPLFGANAAEFAANPFGPDLVADDDSEWEKPAPVAVKPPPANLSGMTATDPLSPPGPDEPLTLWDGALDDIDAVDRELGGKRPKAEDKKKPGLFGKLFGRKKPQSEPETVTDGGDWLMPDDSGRIDAPKMTALTEVDRGESEWLLADEHDAMSVERQALAELWRADVRPANESPAQAETFESFIHLEQPAPAVTVEEPAHPPTEEASRWTWDSLAGVEPAPTGSPDQVESVEAVAEEPATIATVDDNPRPLSWEALTALSDAPASDMETSSASVAAAPAEEPATDSIAVEAAPAAPGAFDWSRFYRTEDEKFESEADEPAVALVADPVEDTREPVAFDELVGETFAPVAFDDPVAEAVELVALDGPVAGAVEPVALDEPMAEAFQPVAMDEPLGRAFEPVSVDEVPAETVESIALDELTPFSLEALAAISDLPLPASDEARVTSETAEDGLGSEIHDTSEPADPFDWSRFSLEGQASEPAEPIAPGEPVAETAEPGAPGEALDQSLGDVFDPVTSTFESMALEEPVAEEVETVVDNLETDESAETGEFQPFSLEALAAISDIALPASDDDLPPDGVDADALESDSNLAATRAFDWSRFYTSDDDEDLGAHEAQHAEGFGAVALEIVVESTDSEPAQESVVAIVEPVALDEAQPESVDALPAEFLDALGFEVLEPEMPGEAPFDVPELAALAASDGEGAPDAVLPDADPVEVTEDWWAALESLDSTANETAITADALDEAATMELQDPEKDPENATSTSLSHHGEQVMADDSRVTGFDEEQQDNLSADADLSPTPAAGQDFGWEPEREPFAPRAAAAPFEPVDWQADEETPLPFAEADTRDSFERAGPAAALDDVPAQQPGAVEPSFEWSFEPEADAVQPSAGNGHDSPAYDAGAGVAHWEDILGAAEKAEPLEAIEESPVAAAAAVSMDSDTADDLDEGWSEIAMAASAYERAGRDADGGTIPPVRMNRATFGGFAAPAAAQVPASGEEPAAHEGWMSWDGDATPEPSETFLATVPDDSGDEFEGIGNEQDLVLRAFEAHARQAVPEPALDPAETAELFRYAKADDDDDFNGLLGEDADELVSEAGDVTADDNAAKVQGWAPQRAILAGEETNAPWVDRSPLSEGRRNWTPAPALSDDLAPPWASTAPEESSEDAHAGRRRARSLVRELVETGLLALLVFLSVRASFQNFKVDGSSMFPTLENGEFLIVNKLVYSEINLEKLSKYVPFVDPGDDPTRNVFHGPERGDIIVLKHPSHPETDLIKRVIGLPGETVEIKEGAVFINDGRLDEPYIVAPWSDTRPKVRIPEGEYFVMGDNREFSADSRNPQIGLIPEELIIGRSMLSYWPKSKFGLAPNEAGTIEAAISPVASASQAPLFGTASTLFFAEVTAALGLTRFGFRKAMRAIRR